MKKPNIFFINAEITDDNIRCGFIIGFVIGQERAIAIIDELLKRIKDSNLHEYDYFKGKYQDYPIAGDDYTGNTVYTISSGLFTMNCIRADNSTTIDKYIAERQIKTTNFQLEDNTRLADHYLFDGEISGCN